MLRLKNSNVCGGGSVKHAEGLMADPVIVRVPGYRYKLDFAITEYVAVWIAKRR